MIYPVLSYELIFEAAHGVGHIYLNLNDPSHSRIPLAGLQAAAFGAIVAVLSSGRAGYNPQTGMVHSTLLHA